MKIALKVTAVAVWWLFLLALFPWLIKYGEIYMAWVYGK